jgi:hypothetical protein
LLPTTISFIYKDKGEIRYVREVHKTPSIPIYLTAEERLVRSGLEYVNEVMSKAYEIGQSNPKLASILMHGAETAIFLVAPIQYTAAKGIDIIAGEQIDHVIEDKFVKPMLNKAAIGEKNDLYEAGKLSLKILGGLMIAGGGKALYDLNKHGEIFKFKHDSTKKKDTEFESKFDKENEINYNQEVNKDAKPGFSGESIVRSSGLMIGIMSSGLRLNNTSHTNKVVYDLSNNVKYLFQLINSANITLPSSYYTVLVLITLLIMLLKLIV